MRIVDLSKEIYTNMPVYEGDPPVSVEVVHTHGINSWELRELRMGSHTGTHVDAFSHMHPQMDSLDKIPLSSFVGKARVIKEKGPLPTGIGLLFAVDVEVDALDQILEAKPTFVGGEISEPLERALLGHGIVTYTNLVNLMELPENQSFLFVGLPLKIKDGDGSPVRCVAILDEELWNENT